MLNKLVPPSCNDTNAHELLPLRALPHGAQRDYCLATAGVFLTAWPERGEEGVVQRVTTPRPWHCKVLGKMQPYFS